jgi:hypothetical protein
VQMPLLEGRRIAFFGSVAVDCADQQLLAVCNNLLQLRYLRIRFC